MPGAYFHDDESMIKTPPLSSKPNNPGDDEMHPSRYQQSTTKAPDSGLRLGFADIDEKRATVSAVESTPSKSNLAPPSTGFDFKWNSPEKDLSSEAQKIMENVREEAARIKNKMQAERMEQARKDEEADQIGAALGGRKFAKPKGKAGRFSDVHKEEFKKMDSIANHASLWKSKIPGNATSLKWSKSKADMEETRQGKKNRESDRLENPSPGKRIKMNFNDDASSGRPVSRDGNTTNTPTRIQSGLPSVVTTPTKSSLARSTSVKSLQKSKIPALRRSRSTKELPRTEPQTEPSSKYLSSLKKVASMKSILHKPNPKFSDDPLKIAAGTHLPLPKQNGSSPSKDLAGGQQSAQYPNLSQSAIAKRVNFTSMLKQDLTTETPPNASPSPSKIPSLGTRATDTPSPLKSPSKPSYPSLPRPITSTGPLSSHPPGEFTFHAGAPVTFGRNTVHPDATSGVQPSQQATQQQQHNQQKSKPLATLSQPTIRHVRPSGMPTPIAAFGGAAVPHGMPNKKRRRGEEDEGDGDEENRKSGDGVQQQLEVGDGRGSPAKRVKKSAGGVVEGAAKNTAGGERRRLFGGASKAAAAGQRKERKGLSLSRLNVLARPKERR